MSEWISANDRLPEENTLVLTCNANGKTPDEQQPVINYIENGEWFFIAWWDYQLGTEPVVTHWMPLPEPPQEE